MGFSQTRKRAHRLAALALLSATTACCVLAAESAAVAGPSPVANANVGSRMLLKHKRAPASSSSSASASSSSSAASSTPSKSASSYISVNLPDSFVQCRPATIDFTSTIGSQDEDLLGDTQREAKANSWLTVTIKDESEAYEAGKSHTSVQLPGNATSWTWSQVDLPAGSTFSLVISSFTNVTSNGTTSTSSGKSSTRGRTSASSASTSSGRNNQKRQATSSSQSQTSAAVPTTGLALKKTSSTKESTQVLAHSFSKSTVVTGPDNDTSCLTDKPANSETDGTPRGGRKGSDDDDGGPSKSNMTTKIVAALLGSLVGVFATILVILAWQRTRDSRRAKRLAAENGWNGSNDAIYAQHNGNASMTQVNGGNATGTATARDRRSIPVPTWDGGYRNSPSAGWTYMSSLVPGLNPGQPPGFGSRGDGQSPQSATEGSFPLFRNRRRGSVFDAPVARRREEEEEDLPSYLTSQEEIKGLPRYDPSLDGGVGLRRHLQEMRAAAMAAEQDGNGVSSIDAAVSSSVNASASATAAARHNYDEDTFENNESSTLIQPQSQSQQEQMQTILRYVPSSAERPYSTLETSQVPMTTPPPRAEVSQAATLNSIDRRGRGADGSAGRSQQQPALSIATRNIGGETIAEDPMESVESPFDDRHQPRDASYSYERRPIRPSHLSRGSNWSQDSA